MKLTLGLSELALVDTTLDGLVELDIKRTLGCDRDLVVRDHILLDGLTARVGNQVSIDGSEKGGKNDALLEWRIAEARREQNTQKRTCYRCAPSAVHRKASQQSIIRKNHLPPRGGGWLCPTAGRVTVGRATRITTRWVPAVIYSRSQ